MTKVTIDIPSIHCNGCVALIELELNDVFESAKVSLENHNAEIVSQYSENETISKLNNIFAELSKIGYTYKNLTIIN
jgi:copper chaperone CopZ